MIRDLIWCFVARAGAGFCKPPGPAHMCLSPWSNTSNYGLVQLRFTSPALPPFDRSETCGVALVHSVEESPPLSVAQLFNRAVMHRVRQVKRHITITNLLGSSVQNAAHLVIRGSGRFAI